MPHRGCPRPAEEDGTEVTQIGTRAPSTAQATDPILERHIRSRETAYVELADAVWAQAELRWQETVSAGLHRARALAEGFTVEDAVAGIPTAFAARDGDEGPTIAFLGEYDALQGLSQAAGVTTQTPAPNAVDTDGNGHGCGHNLLGAASLLAASAVAGYLRETGVPGRVVYYGCPAEEAAAGKTYMARAGAFAEADVAISWHPGDVTEVTAHRSLAYFQATFSFSGRAAHASVSPESGRSALDAIELTNVGINYLREHISQHSRIHYAILDGGGSSPNVVPARASAYYLVRASTLAEARDLYERVQSVGAGAALMTGTTLEVKLDGATSELRPNATLMAAAQRVLEGLGPVPFDSADLAKAAEYLPTLPRDQLRRSRVEAGVARGDSSPLHLGVRPLGSGMDQHYFSSDVGDVSQVVPTVQFGAACWVLGTPGHSWQVVSQGTLPAAHKGMIHAARAMAATAVAVLKDPSIVAAAAREHEESFEDGPYASPIPKEVLPPPLRGKETE